MCQIYLSAPAHPRYQFGDTKYQWIINSQSLIEGVIKEEEDMSSNIYSFVTLSDINNYDSEAEIEIEALSKALDTKPIIIVTRTKKSHNNGVTGLNTRYSSTIIINPDIPSADSLRIWCSNHKAELIELRKNIAQTSNETTSTTTTTNIEDILNLENTECCISHKSVNFN